MTLFVNIVGGVPVQQPNGNYAMQYTDILAANPALGLTTNATNWASINVEYLGYWPLTPTTPPTYSASTQNAPVEVVPTFSGAWTQQWAAPTALSAAQLEALVPQTLANILAAGLAVTSTATAALNATYATTPAAMAYLAVASLPTASAIFKFPDQSGALHSFSTIQFATLAKVLRDYVVAVNTAAAENASGTVTAYPVATAAIP